VVFPFVKILTDIPPSPRNAKELFNLRHASARNVIERMFGIFKGRFRILEVPPNYDMNIQALIPPALAALHNFIRQYDPQDICADNNNDDAFNFQMNDRGYTGELAAGPVTRHETLRANERRDRIAHEMWEQYQRYLEG
jgi:DDE superfamily endonuclease